MARSLLISAACLLALAGCGGAPVASPAPTALPESVRPPDQIIVDARNALTHAASVHVIGTIEIGGHRDTFDLTDTASGRGQGTVTMDRVVVDGILVDDVFYVHGSQAVAQFEPADVVSCVGDRWVVPPVSAGYAPIQRFFDVATLAAAVLSPAVGTTHVAGQASVHGLAAIHLADDKGRTIDVAGSGPPLPLRIARTTVTDTGQLDFVDYGAAAAIAAPARSVDLSAEMSKCAPAGW
jgi:hypothetical protein